jgi:hypothetical protein
MAHLADGHANKPQPGPTHFINSRPRLGGRDYPTFVLSAAARASRNQVQLVHQQPPTPVGRDYA